MTCSEIGLFQKTSSIELINLRTGIERNVPMYQPIHHGNINIYMLIGTGNVNKAMRRNETGHEALNEMFGLCDDIFGYGVVRRLQRGKSRK